MHSSSIHSDFRVSALEVGDLSSRLSSAPITQTHISHFQFFLAVTLGQEKGPGARGSMPLYSSKRVLSLGAEVLVLVPVLRIPYVLN